MQYLRKKVEQDVSNLQPAIKVKDEDQNFEVKIAQIKLAYKNGSIIDLLKKRGNALLKQPE